MTPWTVACLALLSMGFSRQEYSRLPFPPSRDLPSPGIKPGVSCIGRQLDFPGGSDGKASVYNAGDLGLIPRWGRFPGEGNGNPLQCSCLENPRDRGAWWAAISGVTQSRTRLSNFTFTFSLSLPHDIVLLYMKRVVLRVHLTP